MARALVSEEDLRHLWDIFFDSTDHRIRDAVRGIEIAVLGTQANILKHYNRPGRQALFNTLELLRNQGLLVGGLGDGFSQALDESFVDISYDTPDANGLTVIPYETQAENRGNVTAVAVFYGEKGTVFGGVVTLYFKLMSLNGCEETFAKLRHVYPGAAIPECAPPAPPIRRGRG